jgi:hypothetical protein
MKELVDIMLNKNPDSRPDAFTLLKNDKIWNEAIKI